MISFMARLMTLVFVLASTFGFQSPMKRSFSMKPLHPTSRDSYGLAKQSQDRITWGNEEPDRHVRRILENNQRWVEAVNYEDPKFFDELAKGQQPTYLYFGCSDSRVPANVIMGLGPGEIFVHRNIGNLVPGNDLNALSVLEYAVAHLGVTDIIVCGHYECGAVKASVARQDLGTLENWLRLIRDVHRLHQDRLRIIKDPNERHRALVELNVVEQCLNLYKTGVVQRKRIESRIELLNRPENIGRFPDEIEDEVWPRIHAFVFNPADGYLKKLQVNFERRIGSLESVYSLYDDDEELSPQDH